MEKVRIGDLIEIVEMDGESNYNGKIGYVIMVDDVGNIHGTWGGCAIIPTVDKFKILNNDLKT